MLCCAVQYVPLEEGRYSITPELARELVDENTIGVVGILGSTYNGEFEDIKGLNDMVGEWKDLLVKYCDCLCCWCCLPLWLCDTSITQALRADTSAV